MFINVLSLLTFAVAVFSVYFGMNLGGKYRYSGLALRLVFSDLVIVGFVGLAAALTYAVPYNRHFLSEAPVVEFFILMAVYFGFAFVIYTVRHLMSGDLRARLG
ncbi:MAG: hypothetical protein CSA72_00135 [Rhodobacterales bacterium]|nr:MAG: hypothetical protein CR993_08980 [Rhodobacterales bacterium]PIE12484.1 MAG: hypothetical protein CSA72_00135 [Rhodobacterales bacterium]